MENSSANIDTRCGQQSYNALRQAFGLKSLSKESANTLPADEGRYESKVPSELNTPPKDTVLYLAYGSNLSIEVLKTERGVKPLNQINVLVPELELCFDLPGIPYNEPCFANTRLRTVKPPWTNGYEVRWQKGLVGVVYEVTKEDYAKIIATEGGGAGYKDIIVLCFEIPRGTNIIQPVPRTLPFPAHTLFCPSIPTEPGEPAKPVGRVSRPDPDYAQPSARYLKLITDGAAEHKIPMEYQNYLLRLQSYAITCRRQKIGRAIFTVIFMPVLLFVFLLGSIFADEGGILPPWLAVVANFVHAIIWISYDVVFKSLFGDGERTQDDDGDEENAVRDPWDEKKQLLSEV